MIPKPSTTRFLLSLCVFLGESWSHPMVSKRTFVPPTVHINLEVFSKQQHNFPTPYTLLPTPRHTIRDLQHSAVTTAAATKATAGLTHDIDSRQRAPKEGRQSPERQHGRTDSTTTETTTVIPTRYLIISEVGESQPTLWTTTTDLTHVTSSTLVTSTTVLTSVVTLSTETSNPSSSLSFESVPPPSSFSSALPFSRSSQIPSSSSSPISTANSFSSSNAPSASSTTSLASSSLPLSSNSLTSANPSSSFQSSSVPLTSTSFSNFSSSSAPASSSSAFTSSTIPSTSPSTSITPTSTSNPTPATTTSTITSSSLTISSSTAPTSASSPVSSSTAAAPSAVPTHAANVLPLAFTNNLGSSNIHVYVTGLNSNGDVVMLTTEGNFYEPTTSSSTPQPVPDNVAIPLPSSTLTIPDYISSSRVWFADGYLNFTIVATADGTGLVAPTSVNPADASHDVNWSFIELTFTQAELFADISYVDFVGLPLGLKLTTESGGVQSVPGVPANGVSQVCDKLKAKAASDGQPWGDLCINDSAGNLIRVNSPGSYLGANPSAFQGYFSNYIDSVWEKYTTSTLTINTQAMGDVACSVSGDTLTCAGDNRGYAKPTAADIFGCSTGPFEILGTDNNIHVAVVPRLCAAFNRATFLIPRGNVQPLVPPADYYTVQPNNEYSAIVHEVEIDGVGYAFPYDDVAPSSAEEVAGAVFATNPGTLTVIIGG